MQLLSYIPYSGKVWRGESFANLTNRRRFAKLKPSKLIPTIDNPLADLFIRQTFFRQTLKNSGFAKHSARQTFPLYGSHKVLHPLGQPHSTAYKYVTLQAKTSLVRTYLYFEKYHFEIFSYKNQTSALYCAYMLSNKILSYLLIFIIVNLLGL